MPDLITLTDDGLYCPGGGFYIDPWKPVERALVTHAHSDHAKWGSKHYLVCEPGKHLFRTRLGADADIETLPYGEAIQHNGVTVSFHPAGHVLGSAQIRLEHNGEVCVVTGDYKLDPDPTCVPFESVRCHTFLTESTFGLPVYRWETPQVLFEGVNSWWRTNKAAGKTSILYAYSLGKAQRVMAGVDRSIGQIFTHGATEKVTRAYRESGIDLPPTTPIGEIVKSRGMEKPWIGGLVIAPPSADGSPWTRKFEPKSEAVASGWMGVRGARRRRAVDRGFILSDHADWPGLLKAVKESGAEKVLCTHGFAAVLARYLRDLGKDASVIATRFGDDDGAEAVEETSTEVSRESFR